MQSKFSPGIMTVTLRILASILASSASFSIAEELPAAERSISFNADIRPILSDACFACHGPDDTHRAADLRLDLRQPAIESGALVAGQPEQSLIVERIHGDDSDTVMPPPESGKTLTAAQRELISEWIRQGAVYQRHWSFESLPTTIAVPNHGFGWNKTSVDAFVARRHDEKGFRPSAEADPATWLRRVTYDLTGLPPTIGELNELLRDPSESAKRRVVDRLLDSPEYGERMAVMWLDVARYADTFGYQNDVAMEVWPWREWVIDAFNRNLPYDEFLTEQLAGDLIPGATDSQRLATAFNRLHRQTNEGGSVPEEFRLAGITDRTTTAATAFLGLTMDCCRCHDHKFDPIKQKEFYALSAYFADIDELGLYSHFTRGTPTPAMPLYEGDQRRRHEGSRRRVAEAESRLAAATAEAESNWKSSDRRRTGLSPRTRSPVFASALEGEITGVIGTATRFHGDDARNFPKAPTFGRVDDFSLSLWVKPQAHAPRTVVLHQSRAAEDSAFRGLELTLDDGHVQFSMIHFWPGNALRVRSQRTIPVGQWTHLAVTHDGSGRADGVRLFVDGRPLEGDVVRDGLTRDIRHRRQWGDLEVEKVNLAIGARFRDVGFRDGGVDELKVFDVQLSGVEVAALFHEASPTDSSFDANFEIDEATAMEHHVLAVDDNVAEARRALTQARRAEDDLISQVREIMVMRHQPDAPPTHVLERGEYTLKRDRVSPATPRLAGGLPTAGEDRLALANWMTDPNHPLTARVIANRVWHLFFGRGIVVTLEDFGSQGTPPTHPQLLDHLARGLIDHDWDLHWLCREIVLSATYRQDSEPTDPDVTGRDPDNAWLARGPKHRLSAEQLRDTVLAASGLLVRRIGGPSVMPYQPDGLWRESGTGKSYAQSTGDGLYRRSLYTFWKRTAPPPTMLTLDATSRESCTPRRELTTTPMQALVFLNDPQYVEASRALAETLIREHGDDQPARWNELFRRLIGRPPEERERKILDRLHADQRDFFAGDPPATVQYLSVGDRGVDATLDAADVAATTVVVQMLFAYDETIMLR